MKHIRRKDLISHATLLEVLNYESDTGLFRWSKPRSRIKIGDIAGCLHHRGYIYIEIDGCSYAAHRLAWFYVMGKWPKEQIDHINRNRSDNRFENLREALHGQNRANSKHNNKNGFKGINHLKWLKDNPFQAQITIDKKVVYLGCYPTAQLAHEAYKKAAIAAHGEFAAP